MLILIGSHRTTRYYAQVDQRLQDGTGQIRGRNIAL